MSKRTKHYYPIIREKRVSLTKAIKDAQDAIERLAENINDLDKTISKLYMIEEAIEINQLSLDDREPEKIYSAACMVPNVGTFYIRLELEITGTLSNVTGYVRMNTDDPREVIYQSPIKVASTGKVPDSEMEYHVACLLEQFFMYIIHRFDDIIYKGLIKFPPNKLPHHPLDSMWS